MAVTSLEATSRQPFQENNFPREPEPTFGPYNPPLLQDFELKKPEDIPEDINELQPNNLIQKLQACLDNEKVLPIKMAEASGSVKGFSIERSLYQNKWLGNPNDLVLIFGCLAEIANDALSDEPKDRAFAADFLEENIPRISSLFGLEKDQELPIEASLLFQDVYAVGDGSIVPANVRSSLQFARNEGEIDISDYEPNIADFEPDDEDTDPSVTENPHSTAFHQDLSLLLNEAVLCPEGKPIIISDWNIELGAFGEYLLTMGQIYQSIFVEKIPQDRYARDLEISLDIIKNAIREIIKVAKKTQFELEYA